MNPAGAGLARKTGFAHKKEMGMKKLIGVVVCTAFLWMTLAGVDQAQAAAAKKSASAPAAKTVTVTGTVQKAAGGLVLKSAKASYALAGMDLSGYAGKKVTVAGTVKAPAKKGGKKIFNVTQMK